MEQPSFKVIYIVTGAAGYLGSHVVDALRLSGRRVRALMLPDEAKFYAAHSQNIEIFAGDVCDASTLEPMFAHESDEVFIVIHCAGVISISKKVDPRVREVNVQGTKNIIALCEKHNVKRLVHISSVHAIPEVPYGAVTYEVSHFNEASVTGCYAKTKAEATQFVLGAVKQGLDAVVIHPSGIIGPGAPETAFMMNLVTKFIKGRLPAAVHGGFDFVDVRDVAGGIISASERGRAGECYILGCEYYELHHFFNVLSEVSGRKKLKLYLPAWLVKLFAHFSEAYYGIFNKTPIFTSYSIHTISHKILYSHEKAAHELGYTCRPLSVTLADMIKGIPTAPVKGIKRYPKLKPQNAQRI